MSPDFEYFLRLSSSSRYSHTWMGVLWFDLPLSVIIAFIFHLLVRNVLIDHLPRFLSNRLAIFKQFDWTEHFKKYFPVIIISIVAGTCTHLLWDGFTNKGGMFVKEIAVLDETFNLAGRTIKWYNVIKLFSNILGTVVVMYALLRLPVTNKIKRPSSFFPFWTTVGIITASFVAARVYMGLNIKPYTHIVIAIITGLFVGLVLMSFIVKNNYENKEVQL
jgi:hypothetical protein